MSSLTITHDDLAMPGDSLGLSKLRFPAGSVVIASQWLRDGEPDEDGDPLWIARYLLLTGIPNMYYATIDFVNGDPDMGSLERFGRIDGAVKNYDS